MYAYGDMTWTGDELRLGRRTIATIEPDAEWPGMWRVRILARPLSDMTNRTRAKDAARWLALADLNNPREPIRRPRIRYFERAASIGHAEHLTYGQTSPPENTCRP
jgi:hypothetical protein